jgi:hypothetical protein
VDIFSVSVYVKCLGIFMLLTSWNEFAGLPVEVQYDGCITRTAYGDIHKANNYG